MDPMCSWCWAFKAATDALTESYPETPWINIMGGLAADSDQPMPAEMRQGIASIWRHIEETTGTCFNHDFWHNNTPRRSTYPACRAVIAADKLKQNGAQDMIHAIQTAYYLKAQNPSDDTTLVALANQLGIDSESFLNTLSAPETDEILAQHIATGQQLGAQGFPSLFIEHDGKVQVVSYGYSSPAEVLKRVEQIVGK